VADRTTLSIVLDANEVEIDDVDGLTLGRRLSCCACGRNERRGACKKAPAWIVERNRARKPHRQKEPREASLERRHLEVRRNSAADERGDDGHQRKNVEVLLRFGQGKNDEDHDRRKREVNIPGIPRALPRRLKSNAAYPENEPKADGKLRTGEQGGVEPRGARGPRLRGQHLLLHMELPRELSEYLRLMQQLLDMPRRNHSEKRDQRQAAAQDERLRKHPATKHDHHEQDRWDGAEKADQALEHETCACKGSRKNEGGPVELARVQAGRRAVEIGYRRKHAGRDWYFHVHAA
jgi:hypothetical protein